MRTAYLWWAGAILVAFLQPQSFALSDIQPMDHLEPNEYKLNPLLEGLYAIKIRCKEPDLHCRADQIKTVDRLSVIDSRGAFGTWITFASRQRGDYSDRFFEAEVGPNGDHVVSKTRSGLGSHGIFSYVELQFDLNTGNFKGNLVATDSLSDYIIEGTPIETVFMLKNQIRPWPISADQIRGVYKGQLGRTPGTLVVKPMPNGHMVGHFRADELLRENSPLIEIDFHSGDWLPEMGLLLLTSNIQMFLGQGMLALSLQKIEGHDRLFSGFYVSGFTDQRLKFTMNK